MNYSISTSRPERVRTGCLILPIFARRELDAASKQVDDAANGALSDILRRGDMDGDTGQTRMLHGVPGVGAERILLVGCGRRKELDDRRYRKIVTDAIRALDGVGARDAAMFLTGLEVGERDLAWKIRHTVEASRYALYRFDRLKSEKDKKGADLRKIVLPVPSRRDVAHGEQAICTGVAVANGVSLARELGNLPPNICTPSYLARQANALARSHTSVKVRTLGPKEIQKLGMGNFLSVARGSREPAKLILMDYAGGAKDDKAVVLVGKGVTFDSGGISIKPSANMDEMKFDMCGAASVLGTLTTAAELQMPIKVVGIIPATENLPDGNASKPGDIVTSMSGQTVEILNTDAEGRLILSDALTYAGRYKPGVVIDVATLTGACVVALGAHASGLFANDAELSQQLLAAGEAAADRAWELPLWEEYQEQLKSNFADMANIGGRDAGAITAACFLARYTKDYRWAHLDIAGTAWKTGNEKGATGRPVALLSQFLLDRVARKDGRRRRTKR